MILTPLCGVPRGRLDRLMGRQSRSLPPFADDDDAEGAGDPWPDAPDVPPRRVAGSHYGALADPMSGITPWFRKWKLRVWVGRPGGWLYVDLFDTAGDALRAKRETLKALEPLAGDLAAIRKLLRKCRAQRRRIRLGAI